MAILDLFSKRQKRLRGEVPDVYQYDSIPQALRVQVAHIIRDAVGSVDEWNSKAGDLYQALHDMLCREYGRFALAADASYRGVHPEEDVLNFMLQSETTEQVLDVVELSFRAIVNLCGDGSYRYHAKPKIEPREAIDELNQRFREHGVGYQFESGEIIRIDSQVVHDSAVRPALHLLTDKRYRGANEEYLRAHEHYRHGRHKECLNDCLKAFESTLKTICDKRGWAYQTGDTAKRLLTICFQNSLIPPFLQTQFSTLQQNLESGVPTVRNKLGGHGQGPTPQTVPSYFAAYQLHMTASTILFLVEAERAMP